MRLLLCVALLSLCESNLLAQEPSGDSVVSSLIDCSVTILAGNSEGSGIVFTKNSKGERYTFVLTAAHVISSLRTVNSTITPDGISRKFAQFENPTVVNVITANYNTVGELRAKSNVIRYSALSGLGDDLALLHIPTSNFTEASAKLYIGPPPELGTKLYHVGSMGGIRGAESLTAGILSQYSRKMGRNTFDQTTVPILQGSSGGLMSLQSDGRVIGIASSMFNPVYNFIIPSRRILQWSRRVKVDWLFDEKKEMPPITEVYSFPIEDIKMR